MTEIASTVSTTYDRILYDGSAFGQTHPDRLATVARLLGAPAPNVQGCRVLELACAMGNNLIPMALGMPESEFLGVDLSGRQIALGREAAAEVGAGNVRLEQMDLRELPESLGEFDFIIAHGVYSWVPAQVRDAILAVCRRHLRHPGVAYVSYNTLPGWRLRGVSREAMLYHTQDLDDPQQRIAQAKAVLDFLCQAVPPRLAAYASIFQSEKEILARAAGSDSYLFHELLEEHNEPVYFHQFAEHAAAHGLRYLAEAELAEMQTDALPPVVEQTLAQLGGDVVRREQYYDFAVNRLFRASLLIHAEAPVDRVLRSERLAGLYVAAPMTCTADDPDLRGNATITFRGLRDVEVASAAPLCKAAFHHLGQSWPQAVRYEDLLATAWRLGFGDDVHVLSRERYAERHEQLAMNLLRLYRNGIIELHARPDAFTTNISERPTASPWARRQARESSRVTNQRHCTVELDEFQRLLLPRLDGSRGREELLEDLTTRMTNNELVVLRDGRPTSSADAAPAKAIDEALHRLAKASLLVG